MQGEGSHRRVLDDGFAHLQEVADSSLGAIFTAQVIEHLTEGELREMLALARRKLAPTGSSLPRPSIRIRRRRSRHSGST